MHNSTREVAYIFASRGRICGYFKKNAVGGVTLCPDVRHYNKEMREVSFRNDVLPLKDKLFRLALRITCNSSEAEDIVQDTLIKVWSKRDQWTELDSIEAYSLTVCRNLAIDRAQLKINESAELNEETDTRPDASSPYDDLVREERLTLVHRLIDALPERQRTIVQLRDIEEKSYKEIATILNLSEEQVKVNLFRARQRIKQQYKEIDDYGL